MSVFYGLDHATGVFLTVENPKWPKNDVNASKEYNEVVKRIEAGETGGEEDEDMFNLYTGPCGMGIKVTLTTMAEFMRRYKVPEHHIQEFAQATNPDDHEAEYRRLLPIMQQVHSDMGDAEGLRQTGNQQFKDGCYSKAIESYTKSFLAETNNQKKAIVLSNRAQAYLNLENYQYALEDANKALTFDANNVKARYRKAVALINLSQFREAIVELQNLLERNPADSNTYNTLMQQAMTQLGH
uniref:Uncharacterized protein n=1 Tax=Ditylenchus dipsaci TaxID=166011 RepID=A0A915EWN3_9BILA